MRVPCPFCNRLCTPQWFLGRNGWCNGRDVVPLVWDVGSELQYGLGRYNVLQYRSLQGGLQYNVTDTPAEMLVASYLTLFAQRQSVAPAS